MEFIRVMIAVWCLDAQSCPTLCNPVNYSPPGSSVHGDSPGKATRAGCHALLQGIFPTQGFNPGLLHYRQILYHLSHQGSPRSLSLLQGIFATPPYLRLKITGRERNRAQCTLQLNVTKLMNLGETSGTAQLTDKSMRNNKSLLL